MVIEHGLDVMKTVDWLLDIGSLGGVNGGEVIAEGVLEDVTGIRRVMRGMF